LRPDDRELVRPLELPDDLDPFEDDRLRLDLADPPLEPEPEPDEPLDRDERLEPDCEDAPDERAPPLELDFARDRLRELDEPLEPDRAAEDARRRVLDFTLPSSISPRQAPVSSSSSSMYALKRARSARTARLMWRMPRAAFSSSEPGST